MTSSVWHSSSSQHDESERLAAQALTVATLPAPCKVSAVWSTKHGLLSLSYLLTPTGYWRLTTQAHGELSYLDSVMVVCSRQERQLTLTSLQKQPVKHENSQTAKLLMCNLKPKQTDVLSEL